MPILAQSDIDAALQALPGWSRENDAIRKQYSFVDFAAAMEFVNRVAHAAETADHHPDMDIRYNKVMLVLSTHSAGGITEKDVALAREIETLSR